jgi:hypothetical protein
VRWWKLVCIQSHQPFHACVVLAPETPEADTAEWDVIGQSLELRCTGATLCLQVFTFALKPLPTLAASQQLQQQQGLHQGTACGSGQELQLVMEYCDEVGTC